MLNRTLLSAAAVAAMLPVAASAGTIVDTGSNPSGMPWGVATTGSIAGLFTLTVDTTLTGIETFFRNNSGAAQYVTVSIFGSAGYLPDATSYFHQTFVLPDAAAGEWIGLGGLDIDLAAGDYWAAFKFQNGGIWYGDAPSPLEEYAFAGVGQSFTDKGQDGYDYLEGGFRISGDATSAVPLPAGAALLITALGSLAIMRRRIGV